MRKIRFVKAESVCQWCGVRFEILQSPFKADEFKSWNDSVRAHKVLCRADWVAGKLLHLEGLNEAGKAFFPGGKASL